MLNVNKILLKAVFQICIQRFDEPYCNQVQGPIRVNILWTVSISDPIQNLDNR